MINARARTLTLAAFALGFNLYFSPFAARAAAQDAVWFPAASMRAGPEYKGLRSGLEAEGVIVRDASDERGCEGVVCAREGARGLGLERGVLVSIQARARASGEHGVLAPEVRVTLACTDARTVFGRASWLGGTPAAAVRAAYREAELALELGAQALLRVQSKPQGALVAVDGAAIGLSPLERRIEPGPHTLALNLDGFAPSEQRVVLEPGRALTLELRLARALAATPAAPQPATRASPWNFVLGGALALGSIPMLASAVIALAKDGDCTRHDAAARCVERDHFGTAHGLLFGFGAVALLAGGVIMVVQPFTLRVDAAPHALGLRADASF